MQEIGVEKFGGQMLKMGGNAANCLPTPPFQHPFKVYW